MERALTYITLDVGKIDSGQLIKAKRGDSARRLVVSLTNRGRPYIPGEGVTAVFYARKSDGNPCFNEAQIDGCTVTYDFTGQTTNVVGLAACEIRLYDAQNHLLTSPRFEMLVDATEYQDGDVPDSSPEYTALTEMVSKGTELIRDLTDVQAGLEPIRDAAIEAAEAAERSAAASEASANLAELAARRTEADAQAAVRAAEEAGNSANNAAGLAESAAAAERSAALMRDEVRRNLQDAETAAQAAQDAAAALKKPLPRLTLATAREDDGDNGVILAPEGTAEKPVLTLYGLNGDEPVIVRNAAPAERDDDLPTLGQVQELIGQGGSGGGAGYVAAEEPPEDTRALWVNTAEPGEAVALGVTAVETAEGVDLYCTDELGTTKVSLRHGKEGAPGSTPVKGEDYFTEADVKEIAGIAAGMVEATEGGDWIMLGPVELTEESSHIELYAEDEEGNPIAFDEAVFCAQLKANAALDTGLYNSIYLMPNPGVTANRIEFRVNSFTPNNASHTGYLFGTILHRGAWVADLHGYKYSTYREGQTDIGMLDRLLSGADVDEMTSISLSNIYGTTYGIGTKFVVSIKPMR